MFVNSVLGWAKQRAAYATRISWINSFEGKRDSYDTFVKECESAFEGAEKILTHSLLQYVCNILHRLKVSQAIRNHEANSWLELKGILDSYYRIDAEPIQIKQDIYNLSIEENEDSFLFYNRCLELLNFYNRAVHEFYKVEPKIKFFIEEAEETALEKFKCGASKLIGSFIFEKELRSLQDAFKYVQKCESRALRTANNGPMEKIVEMMKDIKMQVNNNNENFANPVVNRVENNRLH